MRLTTQRSRLLVLALTSAACSSGDDGASDSQGSASSTSTTDASTGSTSEASTSAGTSSGGASDAGTSGSSEASTSSSAGTTSDAATSDTTTSDTTTSDTTTSDTTAGTTGAIEDCDALLAAFWAEVAEIRGCEEDKQCGQVLTGTSCGCTRNWVARLDADTSHFLALVDLAGELRCELPFISTCDCPEADGYRCDAGTCSWNYL